MVGATDLPMTIPPGQSPPLYRITPTDQAGIIVIVTAICLVTAFISLLVRAYVVLQSGILRSHSEDLALVIALVLAIVQTSLVQRQSAIGLGRTLLEVTNRELQQIERLQFADHIFFVLSVWASKIATALFLYRLSPRAGDRQLSKTAMGAIGLTGFASLLTICVKWDFTEDWQCANPGDLICTASGSLPPVQVQSIAHTLSQYNRWWAVSSMDVVTEVVLACCATRMVWPLQMKPVRKATACSMFYQRLVLLVPIATRMHYLNVVYHSGDPTLAATYSTLCKEVEIAFAILASNVPSFRPFLLATATNYGTPAEGAKAATGLYASAERSIKLSKLGSTKKSNDWSKQASTDEDLPDSETFSSRPRTHFATTTAINRNKQYKSGSIDSTGSRDMIIRKDVKYDVHYYNRDDESGDREIHEPI